MPELLDYHRPECQSKNHVNCQAGDLWTCSKCGKVTCLNEGCADDMPELCDNCWAAARSYHLEEV